MLRTIPALLLAATCCGAGAQSLYKCTVEGKVTYSGAPCKEGAEKTLSVPAAPAPDLERAKDLKREKAALATLQKARSAREDKEQRRLAQAERGASARDQRCAKLRLEKQWADDSADKAPGFNKATLKLKAQRMGEAMAVECGS
jgi:hypothetical protein